MEARKFVIGDQARLLLDNYADDNPADVYTIARELPSTANVWQYRVKRTGDAQERAVGEQQIARAGYQAGITRGWLRMAFDELTR
jgi:hypothetical protein